MINHFLLDVHMIAILNRDEHLAQFSQIILYFKRFNYICRPINF